MAYYHVDPSRADDPFALPNLEVFCQPIATVWCRDCGGCVGQRPFADNENVGDEAPCLECGRPALLTVQGGNGLGWWYWHCFPGCLPDSDPCGPFPSEEEALKAAREDAGFLD